VLKLAQTKLIVGKEDHGCDDLKVKCSKLNVMKGENVVLSSMMFPGAANEYIISMKILFCQN